MNLTRAWRVAARDLRMGPRSPIFIYAVLLPIAMSFLISAVFGGLLDPKPQLGIADLGDSEVTLAAQQLDGVSVTLVDTMSDLKTQVENHDLDAGLFLPESFDTQLLAGADTSLEFYVSGDSLASNRIILAVTTTELLTEMANQGAPVAVDVVPVGDDTYIPMGDRLLPIVVFYAIVIAALFLPASSILDEREKHTLDAVLVTPTNIYEVLLGKGILGVFMGLVMGIVSLLLNQAMGERPFAVMLFLLIGSIMMAELGLILGSLVKDANSLYTAIKGAGVFIALPVIFIIWPTLPQWIPKFTPTYYFLTPVYEIAVNGTPFGDTYLELVVAVVICLALLPLLLAVGRRAERKLAWAG